MRRLLPLVAATLAFLLVLATLSVTPTEAKLPSWDTLKSGKSRFKILKQFGGQAVLDVETGLVWTLAPTTGQSLFCQSNVVWSSAIFCCQMAVIAGRLGWRLPTITELLTLWEVTEGNPTLVAGSPFTDVGTGAYWSATSVATNDANALYVSPSAGSVFQTTKTFAIARAWCVRGPASSDVGH